MLMYVAAALSLVSFIALVINPIWGVMALFLVRPIVDTTWNEPIILNMKLTEIVGAALPIFIVTRMIFDGGVRQFKDMPLKWIWLLWVLDVVLFSSEIMFSQGLADGANIMLRHLNGFAGFYMVQAYFKSEKDIQKFAWVLVLAGIFPVCIGVYEGLTGFHWYTVLGEGNVLRNVGLYHDAIAIRYLALQTVMGLLMLSALIDNKSKLSKIGMCIYSVAILFVIKGAFSKSGIVILLLWIFLWLVLRKKIKTLLFVAISLMMVLIYYSKVLMDYIGFVFVKELDVILGQGDIQRTFAGRWYIWDEMMADWRQLSAIKQLLGSGRVAIGAHNDYLQILFHGGVVGILIYVTLLVSVAFVIQRQLLASRNVYSIVALLAFVMWCVDTVGLVPSAYTGYQWFVWGVIGLCIRQNAISNMQGVRVPVGSVNGGRFDNLMGID